jgi:hypothetical protein
MPDSSKVMNPDKKGYPGPPGWGLGVGLTTPYHKKCFVEKLLKFETGQQFWKRLKSTKDCNATRRRRRIKLMYCHVGVHCWEGITYIQYTHTDTHSMDSYAKMTVHTYIHTYTHTYYKLIPNWH